MKTVKISVTSLDKASRVELFVRILWAIVSGIVLWFFSILACVCLIVQWFYILITGKRHKTLNKVLRVYLYYRTKMAAYIMMLTEERSPILPED
jgi:hypothetical protein